MPDIEPGRSSAEASHAHVRVTGRVQGVYFRASTQREAASLGLAGWVRNSGDEVEAAFEGPREAVERAIAWCHEGPAHANVERMDVTWKEPEGLAGFTIRH